MDSILLLPSYLVIITFWRDIAAKRPFGTFGLLTLTLPRPTYLQGTYTYPTLLYFTLLDYFNLLYLTYLLTFVSQLGKPRLRYRKARSAPPSAIHWEFWDWSFGSSSIRAWTWTEILGLGLTFWKYSGTSSSIISSKQKSRSRIRNSSISIKPFFRISFLFTFTLPGTFISHIISHFSVQTNCSYIFVSSNIIIILLLLLSLLPLLLLLLLLLLSLLLSYLSCWLIDTI